jgi:hypothetical protein
MITLLKFLAEVHILLTIFSHAHDFTVKHGDTSITKVTSGSEAPFRSTIDVREDNSALKVLLRMSVTTAELSSLTSMVDLNGASEPEVTLVMEVSPCLTVKS